MKHVIKKIIREEIDDLQWIEEIEPYTLGEFFKGDDICFNDNKCKVNINNNAIIFNINFNEWGQLVDYHQDEDWPLEELLINGPNYDGANDYYEFPLEEFDYVYDQLNPDIIDKLNILFNRIKKGEQLISVHNFYDSFTELEDYIDTPLILVKWYELIDEYLDIIGYEAQKNRWLNLSQIYSRLMGDINAKFKLEPYQGVLTIKTPIEKLEKNEYNLTKLLESISDPLIMVGWADEFYSYLDYSSLDEEINQLFDKFIDSITEFLDNKEYVEKYEHFKEVAENYGFEKNRNNWSLINTKKQYILKNLALSYDPIENGNKVDVMRLNDGLFGGIKEKVTVDLMELKDFLEKELKKTNG